MACYSALVEAAQVGDITKLHANLSAAGEGTGYEETALMHAARYGHTECVQALLEREACMQRSGGMTALMLSAKFGFTDCVALLLRAEAGISTNNGTTALMIAVTTGNLQCVELLLPEAGRQDGLFKCSALMHAARYGYQPIVEALLPYERGLRDNAGRGADWYAKFDAIDPSTRMHIQNGHDHIYNYLLKEDADEYAPIRAFSPTKEFALLRFYIYTDRLAEVEHLASCGHHCDSDGKTALMYAAELGRLKLVTHLISSGLNRQDKRGWTALSYAVHSGHVNVARMLLPEAQLLNLAGESVLDIALSSAGTRQQKGNRRRFLTLLRYHIATIQQNKEVRNTTGNISLENASKASEVQPPHPHTSFKRTRCVIPNVSKGIPRDIDELTTRIEKSLQTSTQQSLEMLEEQIKQAQDSLTAKRLHTEVLKRRIDDLNREGRNIDQRLEALTSDLHAIESRTALLNSKLRIVPIMHNFAGYTKDELELLETNLFASLQAVMQESDLIQLRLCVVCLAQSRSIIFDPCSHLCVCQECAESLIGRQCPLCRTPIHGTLRVNLQVVS
ncbi:Ankyrin repeat protein 2 [Giardia muris]|uniref:Ankyrin repeat protein 2 n=1 Tax=Giardia muris TaxID=5742 RepID=A0A4Z1SZF5_GIAMU|nr:Ankyrin repeat protein 2 [Giardia muris]|eukprot:TNJ30135.1 Ankyrin repeat protein 2 [Giardia muris]